MKIRGYLKGKGKLGNIVCSTVAGETIARDYNPDVANPNTEGQVEQRARFKLMSQLSSVMAPVIAIPKVKTQSSRNLFVKKNIGTTVFDGVQAAINLNAVQLTNGTTNIDVFGCDRTSHEKCACYYSGQQILGMVGMVYCIFTKDSAGNLSLFDSAVVTENTEREDWGADLKYTDAEIVLYAYALIGDEEKATAAFGNMQSPTAESVAKLIVSSAVSSSSIRTTKTKAFTMPVGTEDAEWAEDDGKVALTITVTGPGTANGAGRYNIGERVILTATPNTGMQFVGWYRGGSQVATTLTYQFDIVADTTVEARFREPAVTHMVSTDVNPLGSGSVAGSGSYDDGSSCTLVATANSGYQFKEWQKDGVQISTNASYTFTVTENVTLVAVFEEVQSEFNNVTFDGQPWNADLGEQGSATIAGSYTGTANKVIVHSSSQAPAIGSAITPTTKEINSQSADISNGNFAIPQFNVTEYTKNRLIACVYNGTTWVVENVYPYTFEGGVG